MMGDDAQSSSQRRSLYSWAVTIVSLTGIGIISYFKTGSVAEHGVDAFSGIAETVVVTYLGVSAVDRSGVLSGIAHRVRGIGNVLAPGEQPPPDECPPENAPRS